MSRIFGRKRVQERLWDFILENSLSGIKRMITGLLANKQAQITVVLASTMFPIASGTASPDSESAIAIVGNGVVLALQVGSLSEKEII